MSAQHKRPGASARRARRERAADRIRQQHARELAFAQLNPTLTGAAKVALLAAHLANTEARLA